MDIEEIEKKAYSIANLLCGEDDSEAWHRTKEGAIFMAEWMQEQYHKDFLEADAEIEKQHVQDVRDLQEQKQAEINELTNLVSAKEGMIAQMAERMEELDDKVSELTEELDASHIFCEGVKDAIVNKAVKFLTEMGFTHIKEFKKALKGE